MKQGTADLNAGMDAALKKKQAEDAAREAERRAKSLGTGMAGRTAGAIVNRNKALADVMKEM